MLSSAVVAFVLAASVNQVVANPSRHSYAARAYAQDSHLLEDYNAYHARYLSLGCSKTKSDPTFFDACCRPMNKGVSSLPDRCNATQSSSSYAPPQPTTSYAPAEPTTSSYAPATTPASGSSETYSGGYATYFYQNGVAGACGTVHSDSDYIVATDYRRYGDLSKQSDLCGKKVLITNTKNGKTVICTVADACPTCNNGNSLDLSEGAFKEIASLDDGMVPISYTYM